MGVATLPYFFYLNVDTMDKKIKLIGRVDLKTGIAYDLKGNIIPKQSQKIVHETKEELEERLQRRRDWLRGYIGGE